MELKIDRITFQLSVIYELFSMISAIKSDVSKCGGEEGVEGEGEMTMRDKGLWSVRGGGGRVDT